MPKPTIAERLIAALLAQGEQIVPGRTSKYTVLTRRPADPDQARLWNGAPYYWFVGKNGALRSGPNVTGSFACKTRKALLLSEPCKTP